MRKRNQGSIGEAKTGRLPEAQARYNLGRMKIEEVAAAAGAVIRIGRVRLYDFEKMDQYLTALAGGRQE